MNALLTLAIVAHGGLSRWNRVSPYDDRKNKIPAPLLVAIDFGEMAFAEC
jgi:hypothetical protein